MVKYMVLGVMVVLAAASCSKYSQMLASQNYDAMYHLALKYYGEKKYSKTIGLLQEVAPYVTGGTKEDSVAYYYAASHYKIGDFDMSGSLFNEFRKRYVRSPFLEDAEYMYAMGYYYASPEHNRDQTSTTRAIVAMNEYLSRYPNSIKKDQIKGNLEELFSKLEDKAAANAKVYYNTRQYKAAVVAFNNTLAEYPDSRHREEMSFLIVKSGYLLASNSVHKLQKDRYMNMMDYYYNFVSEFPESKYKKEADKMLKDAKEYLAKHNTENTIQTTTATENTLKEDGSKKK